VGRKGYNSVEKHVETAVDKHVEDGWSSTRFSSKHATTGSIQDRTGCIPRVVVPE